MKGRERRKEGKRKGGKKKRRAEKQAKGRTQEKK